MRLPARSRSKWTSGRRRCRDWSQDEGRLDQRQVRSATGEAERLPNGSFWSACAISRDALAREELITRYLPLVKSLARRFASRGQPVEDLIQVGSIGLIKAIDRFDLERGVELSTYATPTILGEIKRYFRDKGWAVKVPRALQDLNVRLNRVTEQLTVELRRSPTIAELAAATRVSEEEVVEALESGRAYSSVSIFSGGASDDDESLELLDCLGADEEAYEIFEQRRVLAPAMGRLDPRERLILAPAVLRGHDPDSGGRAYWHLPDARVAAHQKIHRQSAPVHGGGGVPGEGCQGERRGLIREDG